MLITRFSIVFLVVLYALSAKSQIVEVNSGERTLLTKGIYAYKNNENLTLKNVITENKWEALEEGVVPNFGVIDHNVYLKFQLKNNTDFSDLYLELDHPVTDEVIFYSDSLATNIQGSKFVFDHREHDHTNFIFNLNLPPGSSKTFYLSVKNTSQLQVPLFIGTKEKLLLNDRHFNILISMFFGLMLAMVAYNLFIFFIVKDTTYLYYVFYIAILTVTQLVPQGFAYHYFWPNSTYMSAHSMFFFPIAVGIVAVLFVKSFLKTKKYLPWLNTTLSILTSFYFVALVLTLLKAYSIAYILIDLTALSLSIIILVGAFIIYKRGNQNALFFLFAWSVFLIGIVLWVLKDLGVIPYNFLTRNAMIFGAGIETILLSIGLANRIKMLTIEREAARKNEIKLLKEKEEIIAKQKNLLETKVKERTKDLEKALESIEATKNKLIESEKLASIGELTAGIAHEINNPINFVTSNIGSLRKDFEDLLRLIDTYEKINPNNLQEQLLAVEQVENEIDYEYLKEEISSLLAGIEEGAKRTVKIINSLKNFTRSDSEKMNKLNLSDGINSTLTLLNNKLTGIAIKKDFTPMEPVLCFSGNLNQVFMNVIANAIDAINEKKRTGEVFDPLIEISIASNSEYYTVIIADNGIGMDTETKKKLFDPFFTTKDVGAGTGLGLSISYKFIALHNGEINVESQKGIGSTFTISIKKMNA